MNKACCPYCGGDTFTSNETIQRGSETIKRIDPFDKSQVYKDPRFWVNRCHDCKKYSLHDSKTGVQHRLADPNNKESDKWQDQSPTKPQG